MEVTISLDTVFQTLVACSEKKGDAALLWLFSRIRRYDMVERATPEGGAWLRLLSSLIIALILVSLLYASIIGVINFQRIGV
jgi:hypothetical protein